MPVIGAGTRDYIHVSGHRGGVFGGDDAFRRLYFRNGIDADEADVLKP